MLLRFDFLFVEFREIVNDFIWWESGMFFVIGISDCRKVFVFVDNLIVFWKLFLFMVGIVRDILVDWWSWKIVGEIIEVELLFVKFDVFVWLWLVCLMVFVINLLFNDMNLLKGDLDCVRKRSKVWFFIKVGIFVLIKVELVVLFV